jgi:phosphohistidine phosphatase SixA
MENMPMDIDNERFPHGQVAVMRHGLHQGGEIIDISRDHCQKVTRELATFIGDKRVVIVHSEMVRAKNTAQIVQNTLLSEGIRIEELQESPALSPEKYQIKDAIPNPPEEGVFILLISHEPDIQDFLGHRNPVRNCSIFARDFTIN